MENHKTLMKEIVGANNWEIISYYMNLFEMSKIEKSIQTESGFAGEGVEKREPSYTVGGNAN